MAWASLPGRPRWTVHDEKARCFYVRVLVLEHLMDVRVHVASAQHERDSACQARLR
jgi:hypothetical protein